MNPRKYISIFLNILLPILTLYLVLVWGVRLLFFFLSFTIGWIVSMIANPPVRFLERKLKIVRKHSSVILIVGVLALVIFLIYGLTAWGFRELTDFVRELPDLYGTIQAEVLRAYASMSRLFSFLPDRIEDALGQLVDQAGSYISGLVQSVAASAGGAVARSIPEVFVNTIVVFLSSYLFLAEHDRLVAAVRKVTPEPVKRYAGLLKKDARIVIGGYFLAQFKIMFVIAIVLLVGLLVLQVRYSVLLAVGIAVLDFLPMFGTGTALIPWAVVKVFTGEYAYAFGLVVLYVLTQTIRQIIQPKIVGDSMGLPPLVTLFLLYIGFKFKGLAGMILAVPVGLIGIKFYEYGVFDSFIRNVRLLAEEVRRLRREG